MKVIIAGSRTVPRVDIVEAAIKSSKWLITEVVSGAARGADMMGEYWARTNRVPITRFPADWAMGRGAGYMRNEQMAEYGEALIAIWDGQSKGTRHMIETAKARGLKVYVHRF